MLVGVGDEQVPTLKPELFLADAIRLLAAFQVADFHHSSMAVKPKRRMGFGVVIAAQDYHVAKPEGAQIQNATLFRRIR